MEGGIKTVRPKKVVYDEFGAKVEEEKVNMKLSEQLVGKDDPPIDHCHLCYSVEKIHDILRFSAYIRVGLGFPIVDTWCMSCRLIPALGDWFCNSGWC